MTNKIYQFTIQSKTNEGRKIRYDFDPAIIANEADKKHAQEHSLRDAQRRFPDDELEIVHVLDE